MSVATIRKYYANVQFWFRSWTKDKDTYVLDKIVKAIKYIKVLIADVDMQRADIDDRMLIADVIRNTEQMELVIGETPNVLVVAPAASNNTSL